MAKIICITSGLTGILNASFELVNRLQKEGHELLYASPARVGANVSAQDMAYVQLPAIHTELTAELPKFQGPLNKFQRWMYKFKNARVLRKKALENIEPIVFSQLLEEESPDLLIIDVELHEYIIKAFAQKIPLLLLSQWFSLWKRPGLPYLLHDTIPGEGWKGQPWALEFSWAMIRVKRWGTFFKRKLYSMATDRRSVLLAFAKKEGFPISFITENNWPGPFTYAELPVLSMTAEELEFPHSIRPNLHYIGPMVAANRNERFLVENELKQLDEVIARKKESGAALIYCSVSTLHQGDLGLIKKIIKAVAKRKNWLLVIGMGGLIEQAEFENLPSNVFAFSFLPQLKVLQEADCSINHGGIHTINECIHFKVPMLIYSGKRSDQNGCAARVAYHGVGIKADKDIDNAATIEKKIDQILNYRPFQTKINDLHKKYMQYIKGKKLELAVYGVLTDGFSQIEKIST